MTLEELITAAAAIERVLNDHAEIWAQVIEADGTLAERIYCGSFYRPRNHATRAPTSRIPEERTYQ